MTTATATKRKPTYKIFLLDDSDFDDLHKDLPYMKKEKLKTSLGFANPKTNEAYIRKTGVQELDDSTIEHELQELLVKVSPDEIDGIRYKSAGGLGKILGPVVGALITGLSGGALAPLGALVGAGISGGTQARSQAVKPEKYGTGLGGIAKAGLLGGLGAAGGGSLLSGGISGGTAAAPGFLSKAAGIGKGALLGTPATAGGAPISVINPAKAAATSGFTGASKGLLGSSGILGGVKNPFLQSGSLTVPSGKLPGAIGIPEMSLASGGVGTSTGVPVTPRGTLGVGGGTTGVTTPPAITAAPTTNITTAPTGFASKISEFASKPSNLLGATLTAGSLLPKTPQFEFPQQFTDLQAKLSQGGALSPLGEQARGELSGILSAQPNELFPEANQAFLDATFRDFDERFARDKEALDARYNLAGVFGSGEHLAAVDKLEKQYTDLRADTTAQINQRNFELGRTEKYAAIQTSLGVDKSTMDGLLGLTGLDVALASQIYGVKVADVEELRKSMGTLGAELLLRGSGLQQPSGININVGGGLLGGV